MLIVIKGMPGSNKRKVAKILSEKLGGAPVINPQDFWEQKVIESRGPSVNFWGILFAHIKELKKAHPFVLYITTGLDPTEKTLELFLLRGITIKLNCDKSVLMRRARNKKKERRYLGNDSIRTRFIQRYYPVFKRLGAMLEFDACKETPDEIAEDVLLKLDLSCYWCKYAQFKKDGKVNCGNKKSSHFGKKLFMQDFDKRCFTFSQISRKKLSIE